MLSFPTLKKLVTQIVLLHCILYLSLDGEHRIGQDFHKACNSFSNHKAHWILTFLLEACSWSFSDTLQQTDLLWLVKSLHQTLGTKLLELHGVFFDT